MQKVFFFDIDGTMAQGSYIPESHKKALKELNKQGHLSFICTGRPFTYAKNLFGDLVDGYITSNGRQGYFHDQLLYDYPLNTEQIKQFIKLCQEVQCDYAFISSEEGYVSAMSDTLFNQVCQHYPHDDFFKREWNEETIHPYMFDIYYKDDTHFKRIQETFDGIVIFNDHKGAYSADATTINFDKGDGIKKLLSLLDKYDCETFAFGDGSNDRCMFKAVTHKIAIGNAIDELKNEASYVTKPFDEDGIVHALHHFHIL